MAITTLDIRVSDLEPLQRLIAAMGAFVEAAYRDGYTPPELDGLRGLVSDVTQPAAVASPEPAGICLCGRLIWRGRHST